MFYFFMLPQITFRAVLPVAPLNHALKFSVDGGGGLPRPALLLAAIVSESINKFFLGDVLSKKHFNL
jgi:hypothetical protein